MTIVTSVISGFRRPVGGIVLDQDDVPVADGGCESGHAPARVSEAPSGCAPAAYDQYADPASKAGVERVWPRAVGVDADRSGTMPER